jgi:two-component system, chemotaxis family, response regulator Rcp1
MDGADIHDFRVFIVSPFFYVLIKKETAMTTEPKTGGRPVEILLVEDNQDDALLLAETLKDIKFPTHLSIAKDGAEALDFLFRQGSFTQSPRPDMILLDLRLPVKSGFQVLSEIKLDPNLKTIPVLIFSTSNEGEAKELAYKLEANFFIVKPSGLKQSIELAKYLEEFWIARVSP